MEISEKLLREIKNASIIIKAGGIVVYPTETLYGLGANPYNRLAVLKVFAAKKRASTKPLSVAVSNHDQMDELVFTNRYSKKLFKAFLPGPLTVVLKKKALLPKELTAGSDKLGIRVPDNGIALKLIELAGPITATSANISGKKDPTTVNEVKKQLGNVVNFVINGGPCKLGLPSTVVDISGETPVILREGAITKEMIEYAIGN